MVRDTQQVVFGRCLWPMASVEAEPGFPGRGDKTVANRTMCKQVGPSAKTHSAELEDTCGLAIPNGHNRFMSAI